MHMQIAGAFLGIGDRDLESAAAALAGGEEHTAVAHLAAALPIEGGLVHDDLHRGPGFGGLDLRTLDDQRRHHALGDLGVVAEELRGAEPFAQIEPQRVGRRLAGAGPGLLGLGALLRHGGIVAGHIHLALLAAQNVLGQVEREAVGVVKLEGDIAGQRLGALQLPGLFLQQLQAASERILEAGLLQLQRFADQSLGARQLGEGGSHFGHQLGHQPMQQRLAGAKHVGVAHTPPHDPPQDIAAALVGGQHAIRDQEGAGPEVVGDHPVRHGLRPVGMHAGRLGRSHDQPAHQVDVVVVVLALQDRGNPLQPHAGVDRRPRQIDPFAGRDLLVLHEDQVPDLDEAVAVFLRTARRAARNAFTVVVEDLGARTAGTGLAHGPEVVAGRNANDPLLRQTGDPAPEREGLVVLGIDRDQQALARQCEFLGHQVPGQLDRDVLEVVAEGKVPQHLEEGVMPRGVADVVQVVMLAAGAHALLRRRRPAVGPRLLAGEDVLELHHAGIGEHQGRVVARYQRRRGHRLMAVARKVIEKGLADIVGAGHGIYLGSRDLPDKLEAFQTRRSGTERSAPGGPGL